MYAIIRAGGKQAKVHEGDVLDVERIKKTDTVSFTPLLIVSDDGTVISDKDVLGKATVTAEVVGPSAGPKVDIFKYKAKTGYRRRQGHRQKYTTIKVTKIDAAGTASKPAKAAKASADTTEAKATTAKAAKPAKSPTAKATAAPDEVKAEDAKATSKKAAAEKPAPKKASTPKAAKQANDTTAEE
jgi:large subunit ribosomal protein L21